MPYKSVEKTEYDNSEFFARLFTACVRGKSPE